MRRSAVLVFALCAGLYAQNSGIQGVVSDPAAAAVPDVVITITNIDTGVVTTLRTNERGFYSAPFLPPGAYKVAGGTMSGFSLRVLNDNSTIFVPEASADCIGLRPLISTKQCKCLIELLGEDFDDVSLDWKTRSKEFIEKLRSGDLFEVADVLKKLTYLSHEKKLSFREQTLMEKARFLIVSELSNADSKHKNHIDSEVARLVAAACAKHQETHPDALAAAH